MKVTCARTCSCDEASQKHARDYRWEGWWDASRHPAIWLSSHHPAIPPYGYHPAIPPYGYHPTIPPYGYHPTISPYGYHPGIIDDRHIGRSVVCFVNTHETCSSAPCNKHTSVKQVRTVRFRLFWVLDMLCGGRRGGGGVPQHVGCILYNWSCAEGSWAMG